MLHPEGAVLWQVTVKLRFGPGPGSVGPSTAQVLRWPGPGEFEWPSEASPPWPVIMPGSGPGAGGARDMASASESYRSPSPSQSLGHRDGRVSMIMMPVIL